ncbi:hypothetical protein ACRAWC_07465 [Leifsonia sp. L25]|uniref:hypothetical protein n=1 Tax=Leifsonia sp. L25 TaxID=3423957 RepID=UPI003D697FC9
MPAHPIGPHLQGPHEAEADFVVGALGRAIRVRVTGAGAGALAAAFAEAWAHLLLDPRAESDDEVVLDSPGDTRDSVAVGLAHASALITRSLIDLSTGQGLLFHAAAAVRADGRAILLVGPSGAGKTTAITRLACPHGYLTDETALVGADGRVLPYPKPLSVERGGPAKAQLAPAELGLRVAGVAHEVDRVIVLNREAGGSRRPRSRRLDVVESLEALVPQLSALQHHPSPLGALAELIRQVGGIEQLSYADVLDLDPDSGPPASPRLPAEELAFTNVACDRDDRTGPGLIRTQPDDALETSDLLVLAHGSEIRVLAGVAKTLWLEAATARSEAELLDRLRAVHGTAPGDDLALHTTIDVLVRAEVLEWRT